MALTLGGAASDRITVTQVAALNGLTTKTYLAWVRPTTLTSGRRIFTKAGTSPGSLHSLLLLSVSSNIQIQVTEDRATTASNYVTNTTPLSVNTWFLIVATYDQAASPTSRIYVGSLTAEAAEQTYGTATDGSGAYLSESNGNLILGGNAGGTLAWQGQLGPMAYVNRVLTLGEILSWQFLPRQLVGGLGLWVPGYNGTTNVPDLSGNGNAGAITGSAMADGPPLPRLFRAPDWVRYIVHDTGTATTSQAAQTASATGLLRFIGTVTASQAAQSAAATGRLAFRATATTQQAAQSAAATGAERFIGTTGASQAAQSASATGRLEFGATGGTSQGAQTGSGTGSETFTQQGATSQQPQTASATGSLVFSGSVSASQAPQVTAAIGHLDIEAAAVTSQVAQTASATGALVFSGSIAAAQQPQSMSATGSTTSGAASGTATTAQGAQSTAATGSTPITAQVGGGGPLRPLFWQRVNWRMRPPAKGHVAGYAETIQGPQRTQARGVLRLLGWGASLHPASRTVGRAALRMSGRMAVKAAAGRMEARGMRHDSPEELWLLGLIDDDDFLVVSGKRR